MTTPRGWRPTLVQYFLMVKGYYKAFYAKASPSELLALFGEHPPAEKERPLPSRLARAEQRWLQRLLDCLTTVDRALTNLEHWRDWALSIIRGLNLTEDIPLLVKGTNHILQQLQNQNLENEYTRWLISNANAEFTDILTETKRILNQLLNLKPFAERLESPWLHIVISGITRLTKPDHTKHLQQLQQTLTAAYTAPTNQTRLRHLATFLHTFATWLLQLPLPNMKTEDPRWMLKMIQEARHQVNTLKRLTIQLQTFVENHNALYYYFQQAELSIIRMMLTYGGDPEQWWANFITHPEKDTPTLIPPKLDPQQLLIGVTQSLSFIEDLEHRLPRATKLIDTIDQLAQFLKSRPLTLYADNLRTRLAIWNQYRNKWTHLLTQLQKELQHTIKKTKPTKHKQKQQ